MTDLSRVLEERAFGQGKDKGLLSLVTRDEGQKEGRWEPEACQPAQEMPSIPG